MTYSDEVARHLIIDTDGGVDDILCICIAISMKKIYETITITTVFGNVSVDQSHYNVRYVLEKAKSEILFYRGAENAFDFFSIDATEVHGIDGLGGAVGFKEIDNVRNLCDFTPEPGTYDLLCIGPATNIPQIVKTVGTGNVRKIVLMSGAFNDVGNVTDHAEFNAYCDPHSANFIMSLDVSVSIVPLDVCRKVVFPEESLGKFSKFGRLSNLLQFSHRHYMNYYKDWEGIKGCFPHDTIALLALTNEREFFSIPANIRYDTTDERRGKSEYVVNRMSKNRILFGGNLKFVRDFLNFDWISEKLF